jgi:inosine-uridine nucleoside N-ribohydrolase
LASYPGKVHTDGVAAVIELIEKSSQPMTIIAVGPLETMAALVERRPDLLAKVSLVGMHGSVRMGYGGKAVPSAEWNVRANAAAAQKVLSAPWRRIAITPLDTCGLVKLVGDQFTAMKARHDPLVKAVLENYRIWARKERLDQLTASSTLFDTVAVYLARPDAERLLELETLPIAVTSDGFTKIDPAGKSMSVATKWKDLDAFHDLLVKTLLSP